MFYAIVLDDGRKHASVCGHCERAPMTEFASQSIMQHAYTQTVDVFAPHDALQFVRKKRNKNGTHLSPQNSRVFLYPVHTLILKNRRRHLWSEATGADSIPPSVLSFNHTTSRCCRSGTAVAIALTLRSLRTRSSRRARLSVCMAGHMSGQSPRPLPGRASERVAACAWLAT